MIAVLDALTGSFLSLNTSSDGQRYWTFHHPTLREGFATWLATQPHLMPMVLVGMTDDALLTRTDCLAPDSEQRQGTLLRIPPSLYPEVARRVAALRQQPREHQEDWLRYHDRHKAILVYLGRASSDGFLRVYLSMDPDICAGLVQFDAPTGYDSRPRVLARLFQAGLLPEDVRQQAIARMSELAVTQPDADWTEEGDGTWPWDVLLTSQEREAMFEHVRHALVPYLEDRAAGWAEEFSGNEDDDPVENALWKYGEAFQERQDFDTAAEFEHARDSYQQLREVSDNTDDRDWTPNRSSWRERLAQAREHAQNRRSLFDDIDQ
ncbi:hypothetical protein OHA84_37225 [Streptomyces sp. NBC_00513]|uniref:hypothetical protein n=1 Tax=unclassified Streptomyces TaxID=2593676 RepID=UPI002259DB34|nr:hypothetical protein [Streptomyces sp. NBC_00424]MCX5078591.1 hypothetical protein [Streptomyces sp. NBC_00424]WUD39037.1 hypothetical protein OHA84_00075 [Streptomyces sp. NBC_00513]WUD45692.1 hypothetical protein OHA84_37225 [Streptomyces sp. NBC_00513]